MKKFALSFSTVGMLLATAPALAAEGGNAASIWNRIPADLIFAAGMLALALAVFYRWRNSKNQKAATTMAGKPTTGMGVTIVPAAEKTSKPKHGTEGVCCGSCSD